MNRVMLSLVLTLAFCFLIVLGVGLFQIMSHVLNNNLVVLAVGFSLIFSMIYAVVNNTDEGLGAISVLDKDDEDDSSIY